MQMVIHKNVGDFVVFPSWDQYGNEVLKVKFKDKEYEAFLTSEKDKYLLRVKWLYLDGKRETALHITKEQNDLLKDMLKNFKAEYWNRFKNGEFSVTIRWCQEINNYDYPTMLLDKWSLSYDSKN